MSNIYEQRFFSALKDTFIGHPIKGKSGYVNLMDIKAQYFAEIEPYIKAEIDKQIEAKFREELFEKLYNFFDCYLNETGTVFFANSQIHKNLYEKVYSDRDDVALFWKTQKLYYVKSEANYEDLQTEVNGIKILFDASEIKHAKGNEKKAIQFYLVKATKEEVVFKIRYQESNKYDRLKDYLELDKNNDLIDKCLDDYGTDLHPNIIFANTDIDRTVIDKKTDSRKCLFIENLDDVLNSVKVEYSINDLSLMLTYLHKKGIILYDEDLRKIFSIYKRQNEIDYFIHKDAEGFLKEQFDIYVYNWLFNDLDTDFDAATVKRIQNIKKIAHKVIEYIARFEDELKAIWEKPKFVRNCNYVFTLDIIKDEIIQNKILNSDLSHQIEEWLKLEFIDKTFDIAKHKEKIYKLPFDTKYFDKALKFSVLSSIENIDKCIDGIIIKSDNWQALNCIQHKYTEKIQTVYIDPPFNTGQDFEYKDKYQDSTWLSLMMDRLNLSNNLIKKSGSFYLHLDRNADFFGRLLLNKRFDNSNFKAEITWDTTGTTGFKMSPTNWIKNSDKIFHFAKKQNVFKFRKLYTLLNVQDPNNAKAERKEKNLGWLDIFKDENGAYIERWENNKIIKERVEIDNKLEPIGMIWTDILSFLYTQVGNNESYFFDGGQKPEHLIRRILQATTDPGDFVLDFFAGIGTTASVSHKLGRKWITTEMGNHFNTFYENESKVGIIGRLKNVLFGDQTFFVFGSRRSPQLSRNLNWQGGGFFKYYELEQYEEVLSRAKYQWQSNEDKNQIEQYSFMQDQKLLDAIEIDYKNKNAKVVFENLYPDVDIAETLSNVSGKHIKQIFEDKVVFEDGSEVVYAEMTFEKYPWIKPLIWWNSKNSVDR